MFGLGENIDLEKPLTLHQIMDKADLNKDELNVSLGLLKRKGAIVLGKTISITPKGTALVKQKSPEEQFLASLPKAVNTLTKEEINIVKELQRRKQVIKKTTEKTIIVHVTDLGKQLQKVKLTSEFLESLTPTALKSGSWKDKKFRRYDVVINVPQIYPGKRHFVNQAIQYVRRIWLDMGFTEVDGPMLETEFWNFDALFIPQDHPAREMQDTFFVEGKGTLPNKELVQRVKKTHEHGWTTGSKGWQAPWFEDVARKNVMITHDTYRSAQVLANITEKDLPLKTFQIMKVFRNEVADWKHLSEFDQAGGIVVDKNVNFRHLLGYLKEFFNKMGFKEVRFRPAFFPYTFNSVECEVYHPLRKEWIELAGAGIFRSEVVKPLLGKNIPVLAWGIGLGRIIMDYYGIKDLREFHKNDLKRLKEMKMWMR